MVNLIQASRTPGPPRCAACGGVGCFVRIQQELMLKPSTPQQGSMSELDGANGGNCMFLLYFQCILQTLIINIRTISAIFSVYCESYLVYLPSECLDIMEFSNELV